MLPPSPSSKSWWKPPLNIRVFVISLVIIFIFGIVALYFDSSFISFQNDVSNQQKQLSIEEYEFTRSDPFKVITGSNYLKCQSLSSLEKDLKNDLEHREEIEQEYRHRHSQNNLFCGTSRLSKKSLTYLFKHTLLGIP